MVTPGNVVFIEVVFFAIVLVYLVSLCVRWLIYNKMQTASYVPKVDERITDYLASFTYFQALSTRAKMRFIKRVRGLSQTKKFVGMQGLKVTEEMKVLLSASLVQLTFGLPSSEIRTFKKLMIYPDTFFNPATKVQMKGFTHPVSGILAVSWPDYKHGYEIPDDNYNLGLHELAHALHINAAKVKDKEEFSADFRFWTEKSIRHFYDLQEQRDDFLRDYGGTNFHEFFAVVIEHFFESPEAFLEHIPHLSIRTCAMMKQNPMNRHNDFVFDWADFPKHRRLSRISLSNGN